MPRSWLIKVFSNWSHVVIFFQWSQGSHWVVEGWGPSGAESWLVQLVLKRCKAGMDTHRVSPTFLHQHIPQAVTFIDFSSPGYPDAPFNLISSLDIMIENRGRCPARWIPLQMALPGPWSQVPAEVEYEQANLEAYKFEDLQPGAATTRRYPSHENLPNEVKPCLFFHDGGNCMWHSLNHLFIFFLLFFSIRN